MMNGIWEYFVLLNYKTNERFLCSWSDREPDFFGQKVNFVGIGKNGLGGYRQMLSKGFVDRRFEKPILFINTAMRLHLRRMKKPT